MKQLVCAVVVVYNQNYIETKTYKSLIDVSNQCQDIDFHVIIYDNTQVMLDYEDERHFVHFDYHHDSRNIGVVPAYIYAKDYCINNRIKWLFRLDQDSCFDSNLFDEFTKIADKEEIKAAVPIICSNNSIISPSYIHRGGYLTPVNEFYGIPTDRITFINSMSFVNVSDTQVCTILDNLKHPLDLSDHEFAYKLPSKSIYVLKSKVNHSLSITEYGYVPVDRYKKIIKSEIEFVSSTENIMGLIIYVCRILCRSLRFVFCGKINYAFISIKALFNK